MTERAGESGLGATETVCFEWPFRHTRHYLGAPSISRVGLPNMVSATALG